VILSKNQVVVKKKWIGIVAVAFALLCVGMIPASALDASSWSSTVNVSAAGQQADTPQIVAASDGSVAAVWEGSAASIQASRSTDRGASWATPVPLSTSGQNAFPHIVTAPNGLLIAVWERSSGGTNTVQASRSVDGSSWSGPVALATFGGEPASPQIAAAPNGTITAIWQGQSSVIQTSQSVDGAAWTTPVQISTGGESATSPQIASAPDSSLTAVWSSFDGSKYIVQSSHSMDGSGWSAPVALSVSGQNAMGAHLAVGSGGAISVDWARFDGSNYVVQSNHSTNNGLTWTAPATLSATGQDAGSPQIALASDGSLTTVWDSYNGVNHIVQSSHSSDGSAWGTPVGLSTPGQDAISPQIVAGPDSAVTAVWTSGTIVQASHSANSGASWDAVVDVSNVGQVAAAPQLAAASDGVVSAVWSYSSDSTNYVIQSAHTPIPPVIAPSEPIIPPTVNPTPDATPTPAGPTPEPSASPTPEPSASPAVVSPELQLVFDFTVGEHADGGGLTVSGNGFLPDSVAVVTLHSTPTTLGTIVVSTDGSFEQSLTLPTDLETGVHHIEVTYTGADGSGTSQSLYFSVNGSDVVTRMQAQPTDSPPAWAQASSTSAPAAGPGTVTVGGVTYEQYIPALHPAASVDTVVSGLVLLTILGGVGAVSAFAAGGSIAMAGAAVGGIRETTPSHSPQEESRSASLASAKVKHLKFKLDAVARGDRSSTWDWLGSERLDSLSSALPLTLNRFSPLLARVVNDGAYLRAMFGPLWLLSSVAGIVLGVLSVISTHGAAVPPAIGLLIAIIVLSAFDVMGGLLAASAFTIGVIALGGLNTVAEFRTMLGIDVIFFTVALTASAARPLRRVPAVSASDWFDRIADVVVASLIATWAVTKMIGALPALSGLTLPIADSALTVAVFAGGAIVLRYVLETVATYHYPLRLASVAPAKIGFPSVQQQLVSAVFKTALFVFVAIAYLGNIWPLWVGAALFLFPSVVAAYQAKLPNVPRLVKLIPGGVIKVVLMLCVGKLLGGWLASTIHNPQDFIDQAFVILSLPSLLLGFAGFFGREGNKWELNWPIRIGGVFVVIVGVLLVLGVLRIP
jgi:hypothetical protein